MKKYLTPFLLTVFLSIIAFWVYRDYLLFKNAYLFHDIRGDGYFVSYAGISNLSDIFHSLRIPTWSFRQGMGQNLFSTIFRDPFDIILYATPHNSIAKAIVYKEVVKHIVTGLIFFRYLQVLKLSTPISMVGAAMFSFCGFFLASGPWFVFSPEGVFLACFLLGFEQLYQNNKPYIFVFTVFLVTISMPFSLVQYGLFMLTYLIFRSYDDKKSFPDSVSFIGKVVVWSFVGVLIACPFLIQSVITLFNSPRGSGSYALREQLMATPILSIADNLQIGTSILRLFPPDIIGGGDSYKGWDTVVGGPTYYCGILSLLLLPQLFQLANKRKAVVYAIFLATWLLPTVFPYFRRLLWLFTGDYYRMYCEFVVVAILIGSLWSFNILLQTRKLNFGLLFYTATLLLIAIYNPFFIGDNIPDPSIKKFVAAMIAVYFILIILLVRLPYFRAISWIMVATCMFELGYSSAITANSPGYMTHDFMKEKVVFNAYTKDAAQYATLHDRTFYRIDKDLFPESAKYTDLNFNQQQGYYGTSSYNSFNQINYIRYLETMGIIERKNEQQSRYAVGLLKKPILQSQNRVKYFMQVDTIGLAWPQMWDSVSKFGNITLYHNKYVLPFGYTYENYIPESEFEKLSTSKKQIASMLAVSVRDVDYENIGRLKHKVLSDSTTPENTFENFLLARTQLIKDTLELQNFSDNSFNGTISLSQDKLLYLSIPFDEGWHIYIDGKEAGKIMVNGGMTGVVVGKGTHSILLQFKLQYLVPCIVISLLSLLLLGVYAYIRKSKKTKLNP